MARIGIENIIMSFGTNGKRSTVLEDINLHVNDGDFVSLIGPSGCGKSKLLDLVAGLKKPACSNLEALEIKGTVMIHTADGDLHDIGKNIVAAIVGANGYRVIDLGTSVHSARVLEAIREYRPVAVLGSSLMTSTRSAFLETADLLAQEGIDVPLIVGGGAIDGAFAGQRVNLRYARDPRALVEVLDAIVGKEGDETQRLFFCMEN